MQVTDTDVMLDVLFACTVTVAEPAFELSWLLVAVTVTDPLVPGAVSRPAESIVPALVVQVTAEL